MLSLLHIITIIFIVAVGGDLVEVEVLGEVVEAEVLEEVVEAVVLYKPLLEAGNAKQSLNFLNL